MILLSSAANFCHCFAVSFLPILYTVVNCPNTSFTKSLALSTIKEITFTIKFKIFDFHYPHISFCNFQNSVYEKMWCCLTFVCVYICKTLKCDGTPKCDGHAKVRWFALKCDGVPR